MISSSEDIVQNNIFIIMSIYPDLEDSETIFLNDTTVHDDAYHTKFGNKRLSSSEDIVWTNIHWHFEPLPLKFECRNPKFSQDTLAIVMYSQNMFGCKKISSLEDIGETFKFWL